MFRKRLVLTLLIPALLAFLMLPASASPREDFYQATGTNVGSVKIKSQYLREWSLELSNLGLVVPAEIYPAIYQAAFADSETPPDDLQQFLDALEGFAKELVILQDDPGQLGNSRLSLSKLAVVGEHVAITQTVTIGTPLTVGAGILVAKHWQHNIRLQGTEPGGPNYIWIEVEDPVVKCFGEWVT